MCKYLLADRDNCYPGNVQGLLPSVVLGAPAADNAYILDAGFSQTSQQSHITNPPISVQTEG